MSFGKLLLYLVLGFLAILVTVQLVKVVVGVVLGYVLPVAVVAGVGYLVYTLVRPKSLEARPPKTPLP